ncbi:hypothetical protein MIR68_001523 [Amoeboaphelidium protococcarum]|nr:hypothetical protein MIR68_001523 [Amoeboaphelidium protococcarum]
MSVVVILMIVPCVSYIYPPTYYKKYSAKADDAESPDDIQLSTLAQFRPMFCLPSLTYTPTMMNVAQLLHKRTSLFLQQSLSQSQSKEVAESFEVHALRIIEVSERSSSLIKAAQLTQQMDQDPILKVFRTFALSNGYEYFQHISIASIQNGANDVCETAQGNNIGTLIVPWGNPKEKFADNMIESTGNNYQHHHNMVRSLLKRWNKSMAIVMDKGLNALDVGGDLKMLVPFFGGPDDREALRYARMIAAKGSIKIDILHVVQVHGTSHLAGDVTAQPRIAELDQKMLDQFIGFDNVSYTKVQWSCKTDTNPIATRLGSQHYILSIVGHVGSKWALAMQQNQALFDNEQTLNFQELRQISNIVFSDTSGVPVEQFTVRGPSQLVSYGDALSANDTIRSIKSIGRKEKISQLAMSESTTKARSSVDNIDDQVNGKVKAQKVYSGTVYNVLGETGDLINHFAPNTSLISIRKVPFDNLMASLVQDYHLSTPTAVDILNQVQ